MELPTAWSASAEQPACGVPGTGPCTAEPLPDRASCAPLHGTWQLSCLLYQFVRLASMIVISPNCTLYQRTV